MIVSILDLVIFLYTLLTYVAHTRFPQFLFLPLKYQNIKEKQPFQAYYLLMENFDPPHILSIEKNSITE